MACITNATAVSPHDHANDRASSTMVSLAFVHPMCGVLSYTAGERGHTMLLSVTQGRSTLIC